MGFGQYTIVCQNGDLFGARVNVLTEQIDASAGADIRVYTTIWHTCGYLRRYYILACVREHIYQASFVSQYKALTVPQLLRHLPQQSRGTS